eukprot:5665591-Prymnesium_polylepis.2
MLGVTDEEADAGGHSYDDDLFDEDAKMAAVAELCKKNSNLLQRRRPRGARVAGSAAATESERRGRYEGGRRYEDRFHRYSALLGRITRVSSGRTDIGTSPWILNGVQIALVTSVASDSASDGGRVTKESCTSSVKCS